MADAREQFERWYVGALVTQGAREIERDGQGHYILMQTRLAWQAWHAGWLERNAGVMASDGKGFGAKTPIPSPMDYEGEG